MKSYTPKKKRIISTRVIGAMKVVRVDHRTEIMVSVDISDADARERYLNRLEASKVHGYGYIKKAVEAPKEIPLGSLEELAAVMDDSISPETE